MPHNRPAHAAVRAQLPQHASPSADQGAHLRAGMRCDDDLAAVVHDVKGVRRSLCQHAYETARVGGPGPLKPDHLARRREHWEF